MIDQLIKDALAVKEVCRSLSQEERQKILKYIAENPGTPVQPIYRKFRMEQSECSQHLAILRRAGIVQMKREGRNMCYTLSALLPQTAKLFRELCNGRQVK